MIADAGIVGLTNLIELVMGESKRIRGSSLLSLTNLTDLNLDYMQTFRIRIFRD